MVLEHALLPVVPGREADFEAAFAEARSLIAASPGSRRLSLSRCLERPGTHLLLVESERLRTTPRASAARSPTSAGGNFLHSSYAPFPTVEHFREVLTAVAPDGAPAP